MKIVSKIVLFFSTLWLAVCIVTSMVDTHISLGCPVND